MLAHTFDSPIGRITVMCDGTFLTRVAFGEYSEKSESHSPVLREAESQILEYLTGIRKEFDLPIAPMEDGFSKDVYAAMARIPYGSTVTYGALAEQSGHPKASRAVGSACRKNPLPIIIPCHRVVPAIGGIGNYSGPEGVKAYLLKLESEQIPDAGR
ncbi:MAG: methylated-DNA--[protein]-cysteine S-methyltransferase [Candidatus Methanomethylophilaceae archaeon]|nr:methylated-DNA--[protein]-cysteine S-methyltransferase [Candidatus Methanomethylophilaceae archaeon]